MNCLQDPTKQWKNYDPVKIPGAGILIGYINEQLMGEDLNRFKRATTLEPTLNGASYIWVYAPGGAILYYHSDCNHREGYEKRNHPGMGKDVVCGGEFGVAPEGYIDWVLITTNDPAATDTALASQCLGYVAVKLAKLGIPLERCAWLWRDD